MSLSWWALADSACLYLPETFAEAKGAERATVGTLPLATVLIKAAGHARGNESNVTKLGPAAEDVPSEGSPAKAMKSVFVGALELHREVASAALRNPPKNLYHLPQSEDGIFEPKENTEKKGMDRANPFYFLDNLPKSNH
ncbi:uncharacterized protein N7498_010096 [Penicillium cinerascens]|uniref:Uncharacterized protein n=1 Tax=Penicillium cinerascens TaxID=70096 RepID=A0A9W9M629_9EURO|nr:uncharacterized protein N7498_010096 [Penicillium cinerascens]KAJ5191111.1 hypothetical protein N7498_010096 [Penicillium cinerascens]